MWSFDEPRTVKNPTTSDTPIADGIVMAGNPKGAIYHRHRILKTHPFKTYPNGI